MTDCCVICARVDMLVDTPCAKSHLYETKICLKCVSAVIEDTNRCPICNAQWEDVNKALSPRPTPYDYKRNKFIRYLDSSEYSEREVARILSIYDLIVQASGSKTLSPFSSAEEYREQLFVLQLFSDAMDTHSDNVVELEAQTRVPQIQWGHIIPCCCIYMCVASLITALVMLYFN